MDSGLPVKDVGLSVDTGLSYSEDDYQGHRAASIYVGFQVPVVDKSGPNGHADGTYVPSSGNNSPNTNAHRSSHHKSGHHKHRHHHHHHHHHHHKRSGDKDRNGKSVEGEASAAAAEEPDGKDAPPSQRVQFILGGEEDEEHCPHQLFTEMDELRTDVDGNSEWKETARWVKFEEDVDEGGERWSKPHVATLSLHSLFELRNCLTKNTVLLDAEATTMETIANLIVEQPQNSSLTQDQREKVINHLVNLRHHHQHDKKPSVPRKESKGFRTLAEIGKKASVSGVPTASATAPNLQAPKISVAIKGIVESSLKVQSSSQSNIDQLKSAISPLRNGDTPPSGSGSIPVLHSDFKAQDKITANPSSFGSIKDFLPKSESQAKFNKAFMRKIPHGTEAHNVLVGEVDFLTADQQIAAFLRLDKPVHFGHLTEVPIPTRFLFILLGGKQGDSQKFHEIGRSIATLMADELFHTVAYRAKNRADLLAGIDEFLDSVTVLPPGEWDPAIRIEPPPSVPSQKERMTSKLSSTSLSNGDRKPGADPAGSPIKEEEDPIDNWASMGLVKSGRLFGGLINDIRRKAPHYISDYKDGLSIQCVASFFYLYFACLTPIVTFGGLLSDATGQNMGAIESLLAGVICGVIFNVFAGQPLSILGSTGPVLVFESITFQFCHTYGLDYMSFRLWIGVWTSGILLFIVAFDLSYLVCYITRFTEESFATLIALIFIQKSFSKLFHIRDANAVHMGADKLLLPFARESLSCACVPKGSLINSSSLSSSSSSTSSSSSSSAVAAAVLAASSSSSYTNSSLTFLDNSPAAASSAKAISVDLSKFENVSFYHCLKHLDGVVEPESCLDFKYVPDVFFLSVILFFGTFALAFALKYSRNTGFFPTRVRVLLSDFSVIIAIVTFVLVDWSLSLPTPKLQVPYKFEPTNAEERGWVIEPFKNGHWTIAAAIIPATLATILIFMDQQITAVIVNRREHLLKKGCGYHLDLLLVGGLIFVNSIFGLPWFVAATVLSITYVQSLRLESECAAPGEKPRFLGVRENRLTGVLIFTFIGVSVFMARVLRLIPMPVLYGVFLYMGVSSLKGIQLIDRLLLIFMPNKYQPDYMYLRHVRTKRVHFFTFFQVVCLAALWVIKSFNETSILFPIMILALVGVRKLLELLFTKHELAELDDIMPEFHKKEEAEKLVSDVKEEGKCEEKDPNTDETDSFLKNKQRDINITDEICKTSNWKSLNVMPGGSKKSDNHKKHRNHHSRSRKSGAADTKRDPEA